MQSFITKIIFKRELSHQEQYALWRYALKSINSIAVTGATQFENTLEWEIDYSYSGIDEMEAKRRFADFLKKQEQLIQDFSFYEKAA